MITKRSMKNLKQSIQSYWQKKSPAFTNQYRSIFNIPLTPTGFFLKARHKKIATILKKIPGKNLVDIGCGSGVFMITAIEQGKYAIGVDYSSLMIKIAQKNLRKFPSNSYKLVRANAFDLPCRDNSVDIVLASGLTEYLTPDEVISFFAEVKRVLKKKGQAIITFAKKDSPFTFLRYGKGLMIRMKFLQLPPLASAYTMRDIERLLQMANLRPLLRDEIFHTMYIIVGKKQ